MESQDSNIQELPSDREGKFARVEIRKRAVPITAPSRNRFTDFEMVLVYEEAK